MAQDTPEKSILEKLAQTQTFHPAGAKLFVPDWTLDPGDVVTVTSKKDVHDPDEEPTEYKVPIYSMDLTWNGTSRLDIQSTGNQEREPLSALRRKEYQTGRRGYGMQKEIEEETQQQYEHYTEQTDAYRKEIYRVNGVVYDSNGNIVYQTDPVTGEYILDNAGNKIPVYNPESNGSISGQIIQSAQRMATIIKQSGTVTEVFDKTKAYVIGDCVLYPDANGNPYRFTKDHNANTDWKGTGENGDVEALGTLQSQIDQNVDYTASIYGTVTDLGGDVRQIKGSTIWQNETAIANIIGTVEIDKDGNLKIKDGKGLYVTGDSTINGFIKDNQMTAGYLIKKINGDETEAAVKADKIYLDADKTVKVGEALFITTGGAFWVKRNATFGNKAGEFVTINGGTVNAPTLQVNSGGSLQFSPGSQSGSPVTINHATAASLITDVHIKGPSENDNYYTLEYQKIGTGAGTWNPTTVKIPVSATSGLTDATVANNILTLTKSDGSTVNFSKATSVTGEWGSRATPESSPVPNGTLYVKATQTNRNTTTGQDETTTVGSMDIHLHNAGHWGSASTTGEDVNTYYYRVTASQGSSATMSETGLSFNVDASGRYTAGQESVSSSFETVASLPTGVTATDLLKGAARRYHVTKDGTDVVDSYFRVPNYSATLTPASTSGTTQTLSDGVYGLYVTKDGAAEQTPIAYYEVSGGTGADPKVSKSAWQNGSTTFTAGTSGESSIPVSLSIVPTTNWSAATVPVNPTFRIDDGQNSTGLTGTFRLQVDNDYVYVKSNTDNPVIGTNVLAMQTNGAYSAGQQSVSATLRGATTQTTYTTLEPGYYGLYRTIDSTAESTAISYYRVTSGGTSSVKYVVSSNGEPILVWNGMDIVGGLYPNTDVITGGTDQLNRIQVTYRGRTGYVGGSYISTTKGSTNYIGRIGWTDEGSDASTRAVYSLSDVILNPDDTTRSTHNVDVTYDDGTYVPNGARITIDASAIDGGGGGGGEGGISSASIYAHSDEQSDWTDWTKDGYGNLDEKYGLIKINAKDGTSYYYGINASDVWQNGYTKGRTEVSPYNIEDLRTISITSNGTRTINPSSTQYDAMAAVKVTVNVSTEGGVSGVTKYAESSESSDWNDWVFNSTQSISEKYGNFTITGNDGSTYKFGVNASGLLESNRTITYTTNGKKTLYPSSKVGMEKATITIDVPQSSSSLGTRTITSNGTYSASTYGYDGFSSVTVNVSTSHNITAGTPVARTGSTGSRVYMGSIAASRLAANMWISVPISCGETSKTFYISIT